MKKSGKSSKVSRKHHGSDIKAVKMVEMGGVEINESLIITIRNSPYPIYDGLISGEIKYIGRLKRGLFAEIKVGDVFMIAKDKKDAPCVKVEVVDIKDYKKFSEAFKDLGKEFMSAKNAKEVDEFFDGIYGDDAIDKFGAVLVKLKVSKK